jgi:hypothetical protein
LYTFGELLVFYFVLIAFILFVLVLQSLINRKSRFLYPTLMHPSKICRFSKGDNKSLLKVRKKSYKRP